VANSGLVSVVIPTKNNGSTIERCIKSIKSQTYPNIEIILVDSFSDDDTGSIAERLNAIVLKLEGERTKAKNHGLRKSRGEYVLFIDSDMILGTRVVEECVQACHGNTAGVVIPERSVGNGFWVRVRDFERSLYFGSKIESARFFSKQAAVKAGGFDEDVITYEESTLPRKIERLGYNIQARTSDLILHDESGFNLRKWLRKKKYYGNTASVYLQRYPELARYQLGTSYRVRLYVANGHWRRLLSKPSLAVGMFALKTLEYVSSRK
jgi:glycosyltransferase involved in cell wall biosynthesis